MRSIYDAALVNRPFGDPGILIDLKFERRALLFDTGDLTALPPRQLLRVSDVFVSHTHMDHFAGFDHLVRVGIGRCPALSVYGPAPFISQVGHKLAAYTWNLAGNYPVDMVITAHELTADGRLQRAQLRGSRRFEIEPLPDIPVVDGLLLDTPSFRVRAQPLDHHGIASLAFAFEETTHINVWKNRLQELGLPTGPWLTELKAQVRAGAPDDTPIRVHWRTREGSRDEEIRLGQLKSQVLEFVPGQRVCYVTDVADSPANRQALERFLRDADLLFIEAVFLHEDHEMAARKAHLTARASGEIARSARARATEPFHFSTRYLGREEALRQEFEAAWRGQDGAGTDKAAAEQPG